jgi:hypothetical protein
MVVATVLAATGVVIIGGWWIAGHERGSETRRSTTVTPDEAAKRVVEGLVREVKAGRSRLPVLRCKLATARQRHWCGSARRLTPAALLTPPSRSHGSSICFVQTTEGELWLVDAASRFSCSMWYPLSAK